LPLLDRAFGPALPRNDGVDLLEEARAYVS
jgi:hypothetical protein